MDTTNDTRTQADAVHTMSVNGTSYDVVRLLGKGKGGYSYLVRDADGAHYVLKQIHHEPCAYYQFGDKLASELNDYRTLKSIGVNVPEMVDVDEDAERILKQYIEGPTIYDLVAAGAVRPWHVEWMRATCRMLYAAHTNIDYFPTNFVVHDDDIFYIDYECNAYMEEWDFEHWGIKYWNRTPEYLAYVAEHTNDDGGDGDTTHHGTDDIKETT
ncbi:BUD32 family EKC/KEOPS complex subunit [Bifidobacterium criceti]|uniref:Protein kinase n=1 Tax=Bifidobacterium criceti TaxID=1960969 RepID=A0A2A2ECW7_9BIFI|nr:protein kinase [Bifidobacterium criceti]PAU67059.1 hypothetical protein B1526_1559 [Bifidobacterium criceti]